MAKLIILEGPRTVGKSTVAQKLRSKMFGSTLINLTGFSEDEGSGWERITKYHNSIMDMLALTDELFILDRSFISELIYSDLYKSYNFEFNFVQLMHKLFTQNETLLVQMKAEDWFLAYRVRERESMNKAKLFDAVTDSVNEVTIQNKAYNEFWDDTYVTLRNHMGELYKTNTIVEYDYDVTGISSDVIVQDIIEMWNRRVVKA